MLTPPWETGTYALRVVVAGVPDESTTDTTSSIKTKVEDPCQVRADARCKSVKAWRIEVYKSGSGPQLRYCGQRSKSLPVSGPWLVY